MEGEQALMELCQAAQVKGVSAPARPRPQAWQSQLPISGQKCNTFILRFLNNSRGCLLTLNLRLPSLWERKCCRSSRSWGTSMNRRPGPFPPSISSCRRRRRQQACGTFSSLWRPTQKQSLGPDSQIWSMHTFVRCCMCLPLLCLICIKYRLWTIIVCTIH